MEATAQGLCLGRVGITGEPCQLEAGHTGECDPTVAHFPSPTEVKAIKPDMVNKPAHYMFTADPAYEVINVLEAWSLGYHLGNAVKYIARAGKKVLGGKTARTAAIEDLEKAQWYLNRYVQKLKKEEEA